MEPQSYVVVQTIPNHHPAYDAKHRQYINESQRREMGRKLMDLIPNDQPCVVRITRFSRPIYDQWGQSDEVGYRIDTKPVHTMEVREFVPAPLTMPRLMKSATRELWDRVKDGFVGFWRKGAY